MNKQTLSRQCSTLDFYHVQHTLGTGSSSKVKLVTDPFTNAVYAAKIIKPLPHFPLFHYRSQIISEVTSLRSLSHKNIVKIFSYKESGSYISKSKGFYKCLFILLEYCPYGELFNILKNGNLGLDASLLFFKQIIEALQFCYSKGYAHGDLKPENILIGHDRQIRLIDFESNVKINQKEKIYGTEQYLPPEVRKGVYDGTKADLFIAGIILFIMYVGCPPFNKASEEDVFYEALCRNREEFWKYFEQRRPSVKFTEEFKELFEGMLAEDKDLRWDFEKVWDSQWVKQSISEEKANEAIRRVVESG